SSGLDGCAVTDHNSIEGSLRAFELASSFGLLVVRGTEISTAEGHVLAYGLSSTVPRGLSIAETIEIIHESGGMAVAAHPRRIPSGMGIRRASQNRFDAIEVLNGGSSRGSNKAASRMAEMRGLPVVGGSDAHILEEIGRAFTVVPDVRSEEEAIKAILANRSTVEGRSRNVKETVVYAIETNQDWIRGRFRRM
ncbi:MAG: histidinol-phosphatase, partial [Candidatus Thermoplasmatota archaeon]|nr:histidinol-phosphatase [Candidatus Thermoplasmatota archaeon]